MTIDRSTEYLTGLLRGRNFGDVRSQRVLRRDGSKVCFFIREIELIL